MTSINKTGYTSRLRALADVLDAHPDLPLPYVTSFETHIDVHWYLHIHGLNLTDQKTTAALIVQTLGGKWNKLQNGERFDFEQTREGMLLQIAVARDAVCERVVVGTHEVTVPAMPKIPAKPATPEHTKTVEDVQWVCGSLLAEDTTDADERQAGVVFGLGSINVLGEDIPVTDS